METASSLFEFMTVRPPPLTRRGERTKLGLALVALWVLAMLLLFMFVGLDAPISG